MRAKGVEQVVDFQCPTCRRAGRDLETNATRALASSSAPGEPISQASGQADAGQCSDVDVPQAGAPPSPPTISKLAGASSLTSGHQAASSSNTRAPTTPHSTPQLTQTQASPEAVTANGSPAPRLLDDDWGLAFTDGTRTASEAAAPDPVEHVMVKLGNVRSERELKAVLYPSDLFKGQGYDLTNAKAVYQTIKAQLRNIHTCQQTHVQLCSDPSFSLSRITTEPHRKAMISCALHNGWPPEALHQGFAATIGWLENTKTRLALSETDVHLRSPNVPGFMGGPPSTRKSSLHEFVTKWCLDHPDIPEDLREGKHCAGDGTVRGHRNSILNTCRSGTSSAEGSSVYECPQSENTRGINFVSRVTMLKFVNCERDTSVTAQGAISLIGIRISIGCWLRSALANTSCGQAIRASPSASACCSF